jgi:hypothetical protein
VSYVEVAAFLAIVLWYIAVVRLGVFWQVHHAHVGMVLFAFGGSSWVAWVGVGLIAEDAGQHLVQWWKPRYSSPVNRLYRLHIWPLLPAWMQRL